MRAVESGVRTIVATGPLTNIALAFQKNRKVMERLEELIIMGGAVHAPGNVDSRSEFNFHSDPDAADYVLQSASVPKVLVPLDVTHKVLLTPADLSEIGDSRSGRLVKSIVGRYQKGYAGFGPGRQPAPRPSGDGLLHRRDLPEAAADVPSSRDLRRIHSRGVRPGREALDAQEGQRQGSHRRGFSEIPRVLQEDSVEIVRAPDRGHGPRETTQTQPIKPGTDFG